MGALDCVSANSKMTATESTEVFAIDAYTISGSRRDLESQSNTNPTANTHSALWHVLIDIPLLLLVFAVVGLYEMAIIPSHKAGFFCNDPKLSYPYTGDTVSAVALVGPVLLLPVVIFFITELLLLDSEDFFRSRSLEALRRSGLLYRGYTYGFMMSVLIVEFMKGITGMPRPMFFDGCAPDTAVNCTTGEYISTFECTSSFSWWMQYDSYHSFPSGHAAFSVYCGFFIAWYLQRRAFSWSARTVMLVPIVQVACLTFAIICSLTRITDHRHHWWDVTVGAIIGAGAVLFAILSLCDNFSAVIERADASKTQQSTGNLLYGTQRARAS